MLQLVFAMSRRDLESRLQILVTLVLASSALQFTWSFPPASFLNAVQQARFLAFWGPNANKSMNC
jgi:hypothetical protein